MVAKKDDKTCEPMLLKYYMNEIGDIPLLTAEEEVELAKRIEAGDKDARDKMINSNMRLVISRAKKYVKTHEHVKNSISLSELISAGTEGLIRAVEKFDWRKGYKVSTYATWWIDGKIAEYVIKNQNIIKLPKDKFYLLNVVKAAINEYVKNNECEPTISEITAYLNENESEISEIAAYLNENEPTISEITAYLNEKESETSKIVWTEEKVEKILNWEIRRAPRYEKNDKEDEYDIFDHVRDESQDTEEKSIRSVNNDGLSEVLSEILDSLSLDERKVLELKSGLRVDRAYNTSEVAKMLNKSPERIRQIEKSAIYKLKSPENKDILQQYLDFD